MNNKRILNGLIVTIFLILGAMFVSGVGNAEVSITSPDSNSYNTESILVNATFTGGTNVTNYTVTVTDESGVVVFLNNTPGINISNMTIGVSWPASNGTFTDGTYTINVSIIDNITNQGGDVFNSTSATIQVVVDNTDPNSNVTILGIKDGVRNLDLTDEQIIDYGTELTINCGANDTQSGINLTRSSLSIKHPGVASFSNISSTYLTTGNNTLKASMIHADTSFLGDFVVLCTLVDLAGNSFNQYYNFTTQTAIVDKGSPFANENFIAPIGKTLIGRGTVENYAVKYGALPEDGDARLIKKQGGIILLIGEEEHTVMVDDIDDASATLTISSEPFTFDINVDETKEVDVDGDGTNDLEIYLHKIHQRAADLVFKEIATPVVAEEETIEEAVEDVVVMPVEEEKDLGWLWTLFILVIVIVIFMFILHKFTGGPKGAATGIKFKPRDLGSSKNGSWGTPEVSSKKGSKPFY